MHWPPTRLPRDDLARTAPAARCDWPATCRSILQKRVGQSERHSHLPSKDMKDKALFIVAPHLL